MLSEYGGSYSVVCVINIPAQTAPTAACTSMWLFSVAFLCRYETADKWPPDQKRCKPVVLVDAVFIHL